MNYNLLYAYSGYILNITRDINLRCKKLKAKVNPILKINVNPNKAPTEIQKTYPPKFNPRTSRVSCPTVMFVGSICIPS
jgi:hypothetical protein